MATPSLAGEERPHRLRDPRRALLRLGRRATPESVERARWRALELRHERAHRVAPSEIPAQDAGCGEILEELQAPRALLDVQELPIPVRRVGVCTVRIRGDDGQA